jgi:hypothetical protein
MNGIFPGSFLTGDNGGVIVALGAGQVGGSHGCPTF